MTYTAEMEKAMQQSHGVGYAEYSRKLEKRLDIEKKRQSSYKRSQQIYAEVDRQLHR
ncbi:hypothetical protein NC797_00405 [Aquibacillus sp. 3ASR75-11]|uniref:Uncharacterized protein n=1 Tax=Terrihalobacillus insolitus TaxID=2950438 RepID=A0A9X4AKD3_9BACI|nr:hypothetical protein [Terrihalobacillus insolitus]MDC3412341.1 hypothetical protein [Terrihalobacillus insolitus]MDC3422966.1 hypothetical protein [Terrihalobacillus insolitus]